jgi:hypothetical protein
MTDRDCAKHIIMRLLGEFRCGRYNEESLPLTIADADKLAESICRAFFNTSHSPLPQVRRNHHVAARLTGLGLDPTEVAALCDTTPEYVAKLTAADPTFQELVAYYRQGGTFKPTNS